MSVCDRDPVSYSSLCPKRKDRRMVILDKGEGRGGGRRIAGDIIETRE